MHGDETPARSLDHDCLMPVLYFQAGSPRSSSVGPRRSKGSPPGTIVEDTMARKTKFGAHEIGCECPYEETHGIFGHNCSLMQPHPEAFLRIRKMRSGTVDGSMGVSILR